MKLLDDRCVIAGFAFLFFGIILGTPQAESFALLSGGLGLVLVVIRCLPPNTFGDLSEDPEDPENKEQ